MEYLFERVGRAFSFIWASIVMAFKDKDIFIPSVLSFLASAGYVAGILFLLYSTDSLWLVGLDRSDFEIVAEVGRLDWRSPSQAIKDKVADMQKEAIERQEAERRAAERGEAPPEGPGPQAPAGERPRRVETKAMKYTRYSFLVVTSFVGYIITYGFMAMTISLVYAHLMGKDARLGRAFIVVMKRLPAIALLSLASVVVGALAERFRKKDGRQSLLGSIVEEVWTVASFLILPAIVVEDFSFWKALKRSREIAAKNLLIVAVGEVAVDFVAGVIRFLGIIGGVITGVMTYRLLPGPIYVPIAAGGVVVVLALAFTMYVKIAYYTCLYVNAVETARFRKRVLPVGPLAAALS